MATRNADNALPVTTKFKQAIELMNRIPDDKFPRLLVRIMKKIHIKTEKPFNEEEEQQLQQLLSFTPVELSTVLDACAFIFEQSAYFALKSNQLVSQVKNAGLNDSHAQAIQEVWETEGRQMVLALKEKSLVPLTLDGVKWQMHLEMAQANMARVKAPSSVFQFSFAGHEGSKNTHETINVEFNHEQLLDFYNKLETIQSQLDGLAQRG